VADREVHPKLKGIFWLGGALIITVLIVLGLPFFAKHVPWSAEKKMTRFLGTLPDTQICNSSKNAIAGRPQLQKIIDRLYPVLPGDRDIPISVEVITGKTVNAFASLGGAIYVYDGLLKHAESPEELAGILAHEMEHVRHRHIIQGVFVRLITAEVLSLVYGNSTADPRLVSMLLNMHFSREQESQADEEGLKRLQAAHIDAAGFQHFFEREENQSSVPAILTDHPSSENRAALVKQYAGGTVTPIMSTEEWKELKNICGR